jgi:hypothetical protein
MALAESLLTVYSLNEKAMGLYHYLRKECDIPVKPYDNKKRIPEQAIYA